MSKKIKKKVRDQNYSYSGWIAKNLPYIFFLIFLAMVYIGNAHYTDKKLRKIDLLKGEIKELTWRYMSIKSDVIYQGTYSKVGMQMKDKRLSNQGPYPKKLPKQN